MVPVTAQDRSQPISARAARFREHRLRVPKVRMRARLGFASEARSAAAPRGPLSQPRLVMARSQKRRRYVAGGAMRRRLYPWNLKLLHFFDTSVAAFSVSAGFFTAEPSSEALRERLEQRFFVPAADIARICMGTSINGIAAKSDLQGRIRSKT